MLREALSGLDASTFSRRPPGNDWSIRDVVMHVCDAELVRSVSFRLTIAHDDPVLPAWDEELFKRRLHYLFRDAELALSLFQVTRFANAELLQQLDRASWERTATRGWDGTRETVGSLLERAASHDGTHIAQVREMRETLGMPVESSG